MIREWKRMLWNRGILRAAAVLLILNLGLFWLLFGGNGAMLAAQNQLFEDLENGITTIDLLCEEYTQLEQVQQFFVFENAKQHAPEIYDMVYKDQEIQLRSSRPDLAAAFDCGAYEEQTIDERITALSAVIASADYQVQFHENLRTVFQNAEKLSGISIFQDSGDVDPNLRKTAEDYRRLEQIRITPGNDAPINALLHFPVPGILGLVFSLYLVSVTLAEHQYGLRPLIFASKYGRGKLTICRGLGLVFGSGIFGGVLYGLTIVFSASLLGGVNPERMAQSVPALFSVTTPMTIHQFLGLYLIYGVGVQIMLTIVAWLLFSVLVQRQMAFLAAAGVFGGSWLLYKAIPMQSFLAVLKYANPAAGMDFAGCLTVYRNLGIGAALTEKNWVVLFSGIVLTLLCAGLSIRWGITRYSISSHGRLYSQVQKWLNAVRVRYHALIARLGFGGLECYKIIITQKGALVLAVLCFLFVQSYPAREITYVGQAQFLRGFYEEFGGQGITPELESYVSSLQEKLDHVETEFLASQTAFDQGTIDITQYLAAAQKHAAFDVQRKALATIQEQIAYLTQQTDHGFEAVIVDSTGYDRLLEQSDADRILVLIALFGCVVLSSLLFPMEQKPGIRTMIRSTRKGREALAGKKLTLGLVLSAVVFGLFAGIRMVSIGLTYGFDALSAPAHSLVQFGQSNWNLPIWITIIGWLAGQWMVFGAVSVLVCLLTQKMSMVGAMMTGTVLSFGTSILNLFGIAAPSVWNLLERASLIQSCVIMGLIIAGWKATTRLWSKNGRNGI